MLVLSRRPNEKIIFPSLGVAVQILSIRGNAVKIGVHAPREVQILRAELSADPKLPESHREPVPADQLLQARDLLAQFQNQRANGLAADAEETLACLQQLLEFADAGSTPTHTRPARRSAVMPDVLVERARLQGMMKPED